MSLTHYAVTEAPRVLADLAPAAPESFFNTDAGKILRAFLGIIGLFVLIGAVMKAAGDFGKGDLVKALTKVIGGLMAFAILISPQLVFDAAAAVGKIMGKVVSSTGQTVDDATGSGGTSSGG